MGTRSSEILKEIEQTRQSLGKSLEELSSHMPAVAGLGKKAAGVALGGGGGGIALMLLNKARKRKKKAKHPEPVRESKVVVKAYPPAAVPIAMLGLAVWAGVRLYEARQRKR